MIIHGGLSKKGVLPWLVATTVWLLLSIMNKLVGLTTDYVVLGCCKWWLNWIKWDKNSLVKKAFWTENQYLCRATLSPQLECEMGRKLSSPCDSIHTKNWVSIIAYFSANYRESKTTVHCQRCTLCATAVLLLLKMFTTQFFSGFLPDVCCCNYFFFTLCNPTTTLNELWSKSSET